MEPNPSAHSSSSSSSESDHETAPVELNPEVGAPTGVEIPSPPSEKSDKPEVLETVSCNLPNYASAAIGCVAGAFLGDNIGGVLEFGYATEFNVKNALKMEGGGAMHLKPGQVTDDSEMAISMAGAILAYSDPANKDKSALKLAVEIAHSYNNWVFSGPFDCGNTVGCAARTEVSTKTKSSALKMYRSATTRNSSSLSNGCIMRASPIAVWLAPFFKETYIDAGNHGEALRAVMAVSGIDCSLTHSNVCANIASGAYVCLLTHLIASYDGDTSEASQDSLKSRAESAIAASIELIDMYPSRYKVDKNTVKKWIAESDDVKTYEDLDAAVHTQPSIGFIYHGFAAAFAVVRARCDFVRSLETVVKRGGDTDTNAAIAMAAYGALMGMESIPDMYVSKLDKASYHRMSIDFSGSLYRPLSTKLIQRPLDAKILASIKETLGEITCVASIVEGGFEKADEEAQDSTSDSSTISSLSNSDF